MNVKVKITAEDEATKVIEQFRSSLDTQFGASISTIENLSSSIEEVGTRLNEISTKSNLGNLSREIKGISADMGGWASQLQTIAANYQTIASLIPKAGGGAGGAGAALGVGAAIGVGLGGRALINDHIALLERIGKEQGKADEKYIIQEAVRQREQDKQDKLDKFIADRDAAARERDRRQTITGNALDAPRRAFEDANSGKGRNELEVERILRNLPADALITREERIDAMNEARQRDKIEADKIAKLEEEKKLKEQNIDLERRASEIVDQSMSKRQKEIRDRKEINELLAAGKLTQEQAEAALNAVGLRYADPVKAVGPIRKTALQLGDNMMESRFLTGRAPKADEQLTVLKSLENIARKSQEDQARERAKARRDPNKVYVLSVGKY